MRIARKVFQLHPPETTCNVKSIKERLEWFLLLDRREDREDRDRHFLFLYTTYRLQNLCRHEEVKVEEGGLDWHSRHYLDGIMQAKGGPKRIKSLISGMVK